MHAREACWTPRSGTRLAKRQFHTAFPERTSRQPDPTRTIALEQQAQSRTRGFAVGPLLTTALARRTPSIMVDPHVRSVLTAMADANEAIEKVRFLCGAEEHAGTESLVEPSDGGERTPAYADVGTGGEVPRRVAIEADPV